MVVFNDKILFWSIKRMIVWVVSFVHCNIRVFALNLQTGCSRFSLQIVYMNVLAKIQKVVVSIVSMIVWH